jgi:hypothetical protein
MLGLVENVLMRLEPARDTDDYQLRAGKQRLYLYHGNELVETGRIFYKMKGDGTIDPHTGAFTVRGRTTFRCVFAGQHQDITL